MTVTEPGTHGAGITGTQADGVNTPSLAAVAAATAGLLMVLHIPKGKMFFIGILSMIVAAGILLALTIFSGVTISVLGATPKLHISSAVLQTN
jgi:hypothetical protein